MDERTSIGKAVRVEVARDYPQKPLVIAHGRVMSFKDSEVEVDTSQGRAWLFWGPGVSLIEMSGERSA
jgi:hypothetical protein